MYANGISSPLTNLAHLDWLRAPVPLRGEPGHTTYRIDEEPTAEVVWTYAEPDPYGTYRAVGGGDFDPDANRYGQGAFNADDVSRAAVVYVRHWRATGSGTSRQAAYQLLRALAYLQTTEGPDAGNVVLWMQPDGTLNPSAEPPEPPDPSDSGESYWLARTVWALGEAYAAFQEADPAFAAFLTARFELALDAVRQQSLARYGQWLDVDGSAVPAWLIAHGAGATGEALLGLAAYVEATGDEDAGEVLDQLADGVAAMSHGSPRSWPFGAVLPQALHRNVWHAWGGLAPAGLARAHMVRGNADACEAALADAASFTPHLLIAGGPDNGWLPAPADRVQIAYGAHSRVESLLAVAACANRPSLVPLAGVAAAWFFGNNPAGVPVYDPVSGRTCDGIDVPGIAQPNAGAESTVHGLLAMLALDANPEVAAIARTASIRDRHTWTLLTAEAHGIPPNGHKDHAGSAGHEGHDLTGTRLLAAGQPAMAVQASADSLLMWVAQPAGHITDTRRHDGTLLANTVRHGGDALAVLSALHRRDGAAGAKQVMVQPELEWLTLDQPGTPHGTVLLRSFATDDRHITLAVPGAGPASVSVNDNTGRTIERYSADGPSIRVAVLPGGFTIVHR